MSKTITNWNGSRRVTPARSQVKLGWRKRLGKVLADERKRVQLMAAAGAVECSGDDCEV